MDATGARPGPPYDAVILAGGRAERLGGADKPGALVGGVPLIDRVAAAVGTARRVVVVGPVRRVIRADAVFAREDPPGGGPVPALRAGLAEVTAEWVAVLAADLPFLSSAHVSALLEAAAHGTGAVLVDGGGREQWLTGAWRTAALTEALNAYGGRSLHGVLGPLSPAKVRLAASLEGREPWFDCDTADDLGTARSRAATAPRPRTHPES